MLIQQRYPSPPNHLLLITSRSLYASSVSSGCKLDVDKHFFFFGFSFQRNATSRRSLAESVRARENYVRGDGDYGKDSEIDEQSRAIFSTEEDDEQEKAVAGLSGNATTITLAFAVGLLTGISVVLFNNGVRGIRNFLWNGVPNEGASWLREESLASVWPRLVLVPTLGGIIVSVLNAISSMLQNLDQTKADLFLPVIKTISACFTLGSGNSLGPEGPSVEIGASIAKAVTSVNVSPFYRSSSLNSWTKTKDSLLAAGSASGFSSGFNAAVSGCFFAVESVMWPSSRESSSSLSNSTSMIIISSVIASLVSEIGLGSEPAFKVPEYDFRSFGEIPLYLLLGVCCGSISLALLKCTSAMFSLVSNINKTSGIPRTAFPVIGGFATGVLALLYPEILYWGFENVDILLESRPLMKSLPVELLVQLVGIKILATSLCRATGLVGGYYAPSLFIGAATGMAYGKIIHSLAAHFDPSFQSSVFEVASPQAYGLVGMASMLAGVCQVPLTSVLLLFELTQDYRIVLPLLGAVGLSSWITSGQTKRVDTNTEQKRSRPPKSDGEAEETSLCAVESSLCLDAVDSLESDILVADAMKTRYVSVLQDSSLLEALNHMAAEKQSCAMVLDHRNSLVKLLTLRDIEEFCGEIKHGKRFQELVISDVCSDGSRRGNLCITYPDVGVNALLKMMKRNEVSAVAVVDGGGKVVGLIDEECISVTCRIDAARKLFCADGS